MRSDDDSTLVLDTSLIDDDSSDEDGQTLVQDLDGDAQTVVTSSPSDDAWAAPADSRTARMLAVQRAGMGGLVPRSAQATQAHPTQDLGADPERRMLPFASSMQAVVAAPATRAGAPVPPAPQAHRPQAYPPPAPNGSVQARSVETVVGQSAPVAAPHPSSTARGYPTPVPPPPPRAAVESAMVTMPEGTPPIVLRFLAVCGAFTAVGLMALIYLEI